MFFMVRGIQGADYGLCVKKDGTMNMAQIGITCFQTREEAEIYCYKFRKQTMDNLKRAWCQNKLRAYRTRKALMKDYWKSTKVFVQEI